MTPSHFRALIVISVAAGLAGSLVDLLFPSLVSSSLSTAIENEGPPAFFSESPWLLLLLVAPVLIGGVAGTIGLFFFRRWARTLSVLTLGLGIAATPFLGPSLYSGLSYALIEIASTAWGAALAMAYFSPISSFFKSAASTHDG